MGFVFFLGLRLRVSCLRVDRWDGRMDIRSSWNISSWHRHTRNNARISKVPYCICLCFTQCPLTSSVGGARTTQISLAVSSRVRSDRSHLASPLDHTSFVNRMANSEKKKKKESGGRVDSRAYTIFIGRDDTWFQDGSQKKKKSLAYGDVSALTRRPSISFPVCLRAEPLFFFLFCNILWIGWLNITAAAGSHRKCARASSHVVPLRRIG